jgi:hypothetical protein
VAGVDADQAPAGIAPKQMAGDVAKTTVFQASESAVDLQTKGTS